VEIVARNFLDLHHAFLRHQPAKSHIYIVVTCGILQHVTYYYPCVSACRTSFQNPFSIHRREESRGANALSMQPEISEPLSKF
jgi:hypothetical protein